MLFNFNISRLDQRLVKRYNNLVQLNMNPLASLAPAIKDIASAQKIVSQRRKLYGGF